MDKLPAWPRAHIAVITDKPVHCPDLAAMLAEISTIWVWPATSDPRVIAETALCVVIDVDLDSPHLKAEFDLAGRLAQSTWLPLIFVADGAAEQSLPDQSLAKVRALGASTIRRPFEAEEVLRIIRASDGIAFERDVIQRGGAVGRGVVAAHSMLSSILEISRKNRPFTFDEMTVKDALIVEALGASGIKSWLNVVRRHHSPTYRHSLVVTGFAVAFAQSLGMRIEDQRRIARAGLLHDVGKAFTPISILEKPGQLTKEEMDEIKKHPVLGYEHLARQGGFPEEILDCVLHHHELLDGTGYPDGLKGEEIVDLVRIVTIADIFSALSEQRAYKPPLPPKQAFEIMEQMGGKLDGVLLQAFRSVVHDAAG